METKLYKKLALLCDARKRCLADDGKREWAERHSDSIEALVSHHMPHGSGIDNGVKLDLDASDGEKLVFNTAFHHMDENGYYDGWTEHTVTVRPSLAFGLRLTITGRDRNYIKEYLHSVFCDALHSEID